MAVGWWLTTDLHDPARATHPFRIGFQNSPPNQYVTKDGQPTGAAIEIVAEACRRRNIPIEWVHSPDGPEPNLISGKVDLWPLLVDLPERRKRFYITEPWTANTYWMVTLKSSGIATPADTVGKTVWYRNDLTGTRLAQANFPAAKLVAQADNSTILDAVATGKVAVGQRDGSAAQAGTFRVSDIARNAALQFYPLPNGNVMMGLAASFHRPEARQAADAIRETIGEMTKDGTVSSIYYRWFLDPTNESASVFLVSDVKRQNTRMLAVIVVLAAVLALAAWLGQYLRSEITERNRIAAALGTSEAFLHSLVENLPVHIFRKDRAGRYTFANPLFCERFGRPVEQVVGATVFDFMPAAEAERQHRVDEKVMTTGQIDEAPDEEISVNGRSMFIHIIKVPVFDATRQCIGLQGMFFDVTERKLIEDKLAYERDQLRTLLDSSPDTIYFKDTKSRFVRVSTSKARQTLERVPDLRARRQAAGLPPDVPDPELLNGLTDFDTYHNDDARHAYDDEQRIVRTGEPMIGKLEQQAFLDGTICWWWTSKMPWRDRSGNIIGTFGLSKDITNLKETEKKLEQVHRQLLETSRQAGMAEVATSVLHNVGNVLNSVNVSASVVVNHVRQSKSTNVGKLSTLLHAHEGDLADFLTHDPKGKTIPAYLSALAEQLAAEQTATLQEIDELRKNIEHIKDIVSMQQRFARVSGATETISVVELAEDALRLDASALVRHGMEVVRDYQARPTLTTERSKVLQILVNLIRNAKHACDEGDRKDKLLTVRITADEGQVRFIVADNGVGIPAENLTRIFNHGFTTRKTGHGFGLHSGALAAKELGGSLAVQSDGPGHGATFTLTLPCKPATTVGEYALR